MVGSTISKVWDLPQQSFLWCFPWYLLRKKVCKITKVMWILPKSFFFFGGWRLILAKMRLHLHIKMKDFHFVLCFFKVSLNFGNKNFFLRKTFILDMFHNDIRAIWTNKKDCLPRNWKISGFKNSKLYVERISSIYKLWAENKNGPLWTREASKQTEIFKFGTFAFQFAPKQRFF